jgi:hypothetical protein
MAHLPIGRIRDDLTIRLEFGNAKQPIERRRLLRWRDA